LEIEIPYRLPQESYEDFKRKLGFLPTITFFNKKIKIHCRRVQLYIPLLDAEKGEEEGAVFQSEEGRWHTHRASYPLLYIWAP